jgi:hypothetical protein
VEVKAVKSFPLRTRRTQAICGATGPAVPVVVPPLAVMDIGAITAALSAGEEERQRGAGRGPFVTVKVKSSVWPGRTWLKWWWSGVSERPALMPAPPTPAATGPLPAASRAPFDPIEVGAKRTTMVQAPAGSRTASQLPPTTLNCGASLPTKVGAT